MPTTSISPFVLLPVFAAFFVSLWLLVGLVLASLSGWSELAERFPGGPPPEGQRVRRAVLRIGAVRENGVTTLIPCAAGLYLMAHPLFRFRRPAILVPWPRVRYVESRRFLWVAWHVVELGDVTMLHVRDQAAPVLRAHGVAIPRGDHS